MPRAISIDKRLEIISLFNQNYSQREIARELDLNRSTVIRWIQRYQSEGSIETNYSNCKGVNVLDDHEKESIILKSIESPFKSSIRIGKELQIGCNSKTIDRYLKSEGIKTHHAASKPKTNQNNREARVAFATIYRDIDWTKCIFTDECCFSSEKQGIKLVKRSKGHRYNPEFCNYPDHCHRKTVSVCGSYHLQ